jgi:muramoyltetrapeptide carboxypeptidase
MRPPYLQPGDKVAITCPAKKLPNGIADAVALLQSWGLAVVLGQTVTASHHQFAGNDALRAQDMQHFLNDPDIKAIFAARGGYGTVRIIDQLDFSTFAQYPKWIVGFSDITVLHSHIMATLGIATLHGQMPLNIPDASTLSLQTLRQSLFGHLPQYHIEPHPGNRLGQAHGLLAGGNLSILLSVLGSVSAVNYAGKILFLEDVGEYLYSIDRMMHALKRAGALQNLAGLIVGGFTNIKDNDEPFGQTAQQIIADVVANYHYPVCYNFPAGHQPDNRALIFGIPTQLNVTADATFVNYL